MRSQQEPPAPAPSTPEQTAPVAISPEWTVRPQATAPAAATMGPPLELRTRREEYIYDPSIEPLPYNGPRFETQTPESFGAWDRGNRRDVRESILNGEMPSLRSLGLLALGQFLRSNDTERDQFEIRDLRNRGEYEPRNDWQR